MTFNKEAWALYAEMQTHYFGDGCAAEHGRPPDVADMDAQEYALSGMEARDQQEAEAAAEAEPEPYKTAMDWLEGWYWNSHAGHRFYKNKPRMDAEEHRRE